MTANHGECCYTSGYRHVVAVSTIGTNVVPVNPLWREVSASVRLNPSLRLRTEPQSLIFIRRRISFTLEVGDWLEVELVWKIPPGVQDVRIFDTVASHVLATWRR